MKFDSTTVALRRQASYGQPQLEQAVDQLLSDAVLHRNLNSLHVLLKPNLISAKFGTLACTEGAIIITVAEWFLANGARVSIGDSPAFGTTSSVLDKLGLLSDIRAMGLGVDEFDQIEEILLPGGKKAGMAATAMNCDLVVNLPRVKAHAQLRVTLGVKNFFGCLAGLRKPWWHMIHGGAHGIFSDLLVELLSVLPPSVTLIDGILAMHESGPINGSPYPLALLGCSVNPVALDTALLQVLNIEPSDSPLWLAAKRANISGALPGDINYSLGSIKELKKRDFLVPGNLNPIRFNPFRFVRSTIRRLFL